jgi:hypothetical protein
LGKGVKVSDVEPSQTKRRANGWTSSWLANGDKNFDIYLLVLESERRIRLGGESQKGM